MNENTLILTEHRLLPRLFDAVLTLLAWGGFLFFLYALFIRHGIMTAPLILGGALWFPRKRALRPGPMC